MSSSVPGIPGVVSDLSDNAQRVERTRSITGLLAVATGDTVIALAAIIALLKISGDSTATSAMVSILTSAFTAVGTLTTAYFGIKAASNTAQSSINAQPQQSSYINEPPPEATTGVAVTSS